MKKPEILPLKSLLLIDASPSDTLPEGPAIPVAEGWVVIGNRLVAVPPPKAPRRAIAVSYEIVTSESAELGGAEERGWIDEEGVSMEPDEDDVEEGLTAVDLAVAYLLKHGVTETSSEPPGGLDTWGIASGYRHHCDTGAEENWHFFLRGFSDEEARAVWTRIRRQ